MSAKYTLDPLIGMPAPARREYFDNTVGALTTTLLGIAPDSPESDHLRQHQIDNDSLVGNLDVSERSQAAINESPHSAASAILPRSQGVSPEPRPPVQRANEWLIALSASEPAD